MIFRILPFMTNIWIFMVCGLDMTEDLKQGRFGKRYRESTYALLELYEMGTRS